MWLSGEVVTVVVGVPIEGKFGGSLGAEKAGVLGMARDGLGLTGTADVAIQADDFVALGHDDMQVVADQQDADATLGSNAADQTVKLCLARIVDAADGFVEDEEMRVAQERASDQDALEFATG